MRLAGLAAPKKVNETRDEASVEKFIKLTKMHFQERRDGYCNIFNGERDEMKYGTP